jgi:hypothetical protein
LNTPNGKKQHQKWKNLPPTGNSKLNALTKIAIYQVRIMIKVTPINTDKWLIINDSTI